MNLRFAVRCVVKLAWVASVLIMPAAVPTPIEQDAQVQLYDWAQGASSFEVLENATSSSSCKDPPLHQGTATYTSLRLAKLIARPAPEVIGALGNITAQPGLSAFGARGPPRC